MTGIGGRGARTLHSCAASPTTRVHLGDPVREPDGPASVPEARTAYEELRRGRRPPVPSRRRSRARGAARPAAPTSSALGAPAASAAPRRGERASPFRGLHRRLEAIEVLRLGKHVEAAVRLPERRLSESREGAGLLGRERADGLSDTRRAVEQEPTSGSPPSRGGTIARRSRVSGFARPRRGGCRGRDRRRGHPGASRRHEKELIAGRHHPLDDRSASGARTYCSTARFSGARQPG